MGCGATAFSLLLRNSKHFAKYIAGQGWISLQCCEGGPIYRSFYQYLAAESRQQINALPMELSKTNLTIRPVYKRERAFIEYSGRPKVLTQEQVENAYNVVLLGPTGCGKSGLI